MGVLITSAPCMRARWHFLRHCPCRPAFRKSLPLHRSSKIPPVAMPTTVVTSFRKSCLKHWPRQFSPPTRWENFQGSRMPSRFKSSKRFVKSRTKSTLPANHYSFTNSNNEKPKLYQTQDSRRRHTACVALAGRKANVLCSLKCGSWFSLHVRRVRPRVRHRRC